MTKKTLMLVVITLLISTIGYAQSKVTKNKNANKIKIKIKVSEIPTVVTKTLNKQYNNFTAEKAYKTKKNNKQAYFISLIKNETITVVYIDTNGNILNDKND